MWVAVPIIPVNDCNNNAKIDNTKMRMVMYKLGQCELAREECAGTIIAKSVCQMALQELERERRHAVRTTAV